MWHYITSGLSILALLIRSAISHSSGYCPYEGGQTRPRLNPQLPQADQLFIHVSINVLIVFISLFKCFPFVVMNLLSMNICYFASSQVIAYVKFQDVIKKNTNLPRYISYLVLSINDINYRLVYNFPQFSAVGHLSGQLETPCKSNFKQFTSKLQMALMPPS